MEPVSGVVVVGGGPAGMMAAVQAAAGGARTVLLEKKDRLGLKLGISGKGRCNLTNWTDVEGLVQGIPGNGRFLYSAFANFGPPDLVSFLDKLGVPTVVERGRRMFPVSNRALDVVRALKGAVAAAGVKVRTVAPVAGLLPPASDGGTWVVVTAGGERFQGHAVVLATGGASYPATGSTGDGYRLAAGVGHRIVEPRPSLVPMICAEEFVAALAGLTLENVQVTLVAGDGAGKAAKTGLGVSLFGDLLFTHFGVSGPTVLSLSRALATGRIPLPAVLSIDLKPALSLEQLDARLLRDFGAETRRQYKNALGGLLPRSLIPVIIGLSHIPPEKPVHQITRSERERLARLLKGMRLTVTATRSWEEAVVTTGGVDVGQVDPRTMESRLCPGLFFAGEVLDVDGFTGGYNLQAAFSTGHLAGRVAARKALSQAHKAPGLGHTSVGEGTREGWGVAPFPFLR